MSGDALAVAMDLLRAPALRIALRQRPLPADVGELIELASGEPGRLARVAASRGEAPERMLEAARFYVREVLLFAGADAYRVLGVTPGASAEQIKLHHRLLQHWLHPDRRGNEWESAFATRINAAWGELRSPERRAAYDDRQPSDAEGSRRMLVNQWRPAPLQERRSLGWLVVGASAVVCAWLLVLVDRQATAPAPEWNPGGSDAAEPEQDSIAGSFQEALETAGVLAEPQPQPRPNMGLPREGPDKERDPPRYKAPAIAATKVAVSRPSRPTPKPTALPVATSAKPAASRPAYTEWVNDRKTAVPVAPVSASKPPRLTPAATPPRLSAAATPARVPPAATPPRLSAAATPARVPLAATPPRLTAAAALARIPTVATPPRIPPPAAPRAAVSAVPVASNVVPADAAALVERVGLLRRRGSELTRYLAGAAGPAPPIWRSIAVQDRAMTLRTRLGGGRVRFAEPAWRVTADRASMSTRTQRASAPLELRAEFVWRNDMWLVETLHTEDLQ